MNSALQIRNVRAKSNNLFTWGILLYILLGFVIAFVDMKALVMYLTVLPLQFLFLKCGFNLKNIPLVVFLLLTFLAQGINPVFFYLNRENAKSVGFNAIGHFDFTFAHYFSAYSYVFVFCLTLIVVSNIMQRDKRKRDYVIPFVVDMAKYYYRHNKTKNVYLLYMILFTILMVSLSVWMYNNQIGLIGLRQKGLPYHLSGILFYFRRFVGTIIMLYFYVKCKHKNVALFILGVYSLGIAITGTSRSLGALSLLPVAAYSFIVKERGRGIVTIIMYAFLYTMVSTARHLVFSYDHIVYSPMEVINYSINNFLLGDKNFIMTFASEFTGRLYGSQTLVLMDQQNVASLGDVVNYYLTGRTNFDILGMHGVVFDPQGEYAFGISIGLIGNIILLSNHKILITIVQAIINAIILYYVNSNIQCILSSKAKILIKVIALLLMLFVMMSHYGGSFSKVYVCFIAIIFLRYLYVKRKPYSR